MKVQFAKRFLKDLAAVPSPYQQKIEQFVFEELPTFYRIEDSGAVRLSGFRLYYKVRFGEYRVGLHYANNVVTLERVLHRKEIYRYFPGD